MAEVAKVLMEHGISAAPVIDRDELVGIVSEGDLVRRAEIGTSERSRSWWLQLFTAESKLTREYVKTHASRVRDIMQDKVVTVAEDTPLHEIAATLEPHQACTGRKEQSRARNRQPRRHRAATCGPSKGAAGIPAERQRDPR